MGQASRAGRAGPVIRAGRRTGLALIVVMVVAGSLGWLHLARGRSPADGTVTFPSAPYWSARGVVVDELLPGSSGLRVGDCVVSLDGQPLEELVRSPGVRYRVGQVVTYGVHRAATGPDDSACAGPLVDVQVTLVPYRPLAILAQHPSILPLAACLLGLGVFLVVVRPRHDATRALLVGACFYPFGVTEWPFGTQVVDLAAGRLWPFVLGDIANAMFWGALLVMAVCLPRLQPPPRWILVSCLVAPLALHLLYLIITLPAQSSQLGRLARMVTVSLAAAYTVPLLMVLGLLSGYRALGRDEKRRAVRWVVVPFTIAALSYLGLGQVPAALTDRPLVPWTWLYGMFLLVLVALIVSVVRNHLFEVRLVIRRWGLRLAVLAIGAGAVLALWSGLVLVLDSSLEPVAAVVVGICAIVLCTGLTRLDRAVQRRIFGARADGTAMLSALTPRTATLTTDESGLLASLDALRIALRLAFVRLDLTMPGMAPLTVERGTPRRPDRVIALRADGAVLGELSLAARPGLEPLGRTDERLLAALGHMLASNAYNVALQLAIRDALTRAVTAREEERRRFRREVHDGIGPLLAAALLRTELLAASLPAQHDQALDKLKMLQETALSDLRRLVDGLRPPALDHGELDAALRQHADLSVIGNGRTSPVVSVEVIGNLQQLPAAVEVAAYRIGQEAITNASKHALSDRIDVRIERTPNSLLLEVIDHGRGVTSAPNGAGLGLVSMRERAAELGGEFSTETLAPNGTRVRVRLPIATSGDLSGMAATRCRR